MRLACFGTQLWGALWKALLAAPDAQWWCHGARLQAISATFGPYSAPGGHHERAPGRKTTLQRARQAFARLPRRETLQILVAGGLGGPDGGQ